MKPYRKTSRQPTGDDLSEIRKLLDLRRAAKKPQAWIAEHVGVTAQQWGKYERGEDRMPIGRYRLAFEALEAAVADHLALVTGRDERVSLWVRSLTDDADAFDFQIFREALGRIEARRRRTHRPSVAR